MQKPDAPKLSPTMINKLLEQKQERERVHAILQEEVKEYSAVLNRIFSTRDGQYLLKKMIRYTCLLAFDNKFDASMIEAKGKEKVLTELILPYLAKQHLAKAIVE